MIDLKEVRWGNTLLQKQQGRIAPVSCGPEQMALLANGKAADFFPVVLKAEVLEGAGFSENKDYALYPQAREFKRVLPVKGKEHHELVAYVKSNGECLAWYNVNGLTASNAVRQLHQLQNLHYTLTGEEL
ncbi:hypothetical protein EPD60_08875 [Flaviaesturariibacter flavus]|uniref:Uncharacterized protein n=1 Tax=Flaviaesturariibacter flavus TaxID=2502780 RepID=A0A4R1BAY3_9BACT|nr:hypothetical protein [Flaviaesturariibacter flavus]TCJ14114.1 hypothetical protein EPD60_08875 [Flaviaesturariibacter flavus]